MNKTFLILIFFSFVFFAFYSKITNLVFNKDKIDVFKEDLQQIAFYFKPFDDKLSDFLLKLDFIVKDYIDWKNILNTREKEIEDMRWYIRTNKDYLTNLWFSKYEWLFDFLSNLRWHKTEIFELLWKNKEYNYLVILQNTNESRPNWWFFGSFAFITVANWQLKELEIVDSYYPDYVAYKTYIPAPEWAVFIPEKQIWFLSANKFWFTDIDWKNIKLIYEKAFNETYDMEKIKKTINPDLYPKLLHKNIKWVIFVRTDFFEEIMPNLTEKIWERQFVNANIDIIRWEIKWNKKELYIKEVKDYFNNNKFKIAKDIINNFQEILDKKMINIYLSNVSDSLNNFLKESNLTNIYNTWFIYSWDSNNSFNKSDWFVTKNIQIQDEFWKIIIDVNTDIVDIKNLNPGKYTMNIIYNLNVPEYYKNYIYSLEKKYNIKMTEREHWILALKPAQYEPDKILKRRESNSTIYFPLNFEITNITWNIFNQKYFQSPFANWLYYQTRIIENNVIKNVNIDFKVN